MSNKIDFNISECTRASVPAGLPLVFINGRLCEYLAVTKIVKASYPEFGWAEIVYNPAVSKTKEGVAPADIEYYVPMGSRVQIVQQYNGCVESAAMSHHLLFSGYMDSMETDTTESTIKVVIIARDVSCKFEKIMVSGKRVLDNGNNFVLAYKDLVFNLDGQSNRSKFMIANKGLSYHCFCEDNDIAEEFNAAQAINYLLCEYVLHGLIVSPDLELLTRISRYAPICDLNIEGLSLIAAINKICESIGMEFMFVPNQNECLPDVSIVFYWPGRRRSVELNQQCPGDTFNLSRTNIHTLSSRRTCWPITYRYTGVGQAKRFEATFELVKAWDPSKENLNYESYSTSYINFESVENVYRKWCLNEAGDYSFSPYNQGDMYNFEDVFGTAQYIHKRREFLDCLSTDSNGQSQGVYLEISYDSGNTWEMCSAGFKVLNDECGIWISEKTFWDEFWDAERANSLKLRVTAVVESDEHLSYSIADGPTNSCAEVVDCNIDLPRKFYYSVVTNRSVFYKNNLMDIGEPAEIDDTCLLANYVRLYANSDKNIIEEIAVTTPMVRTNFEPGDKVITSHDSEDVLGVRADTRSLFWINRVEIDYENQLTKLEILRQRSYLL